MGLKIFEIKALAHKIYEQVKYNVEEYNRNIKKGSTQEKYERTLDKVSDARYKRAVEILNGADLGLNLKVSDIRESNLLYYLRDNLRKAVIKEMKQKPAPLKPWPIYTDIYNDVVIAHIDPSFNVEETFNSLTKKYS